MRTERRAKILIDGERVARGSLDKLDLEAGAYLVEIQLAGYKDFKRVVVIEASGSSIIEAPLVSLASKRRPRADRVISSKPREPARPAPIKPEAPEPVKPKANKPDCRMPFYFKGGKKIFKSACL